MSAELIELKKSLSPQELEILKTELERKRKSVILAYILWLLLSVFGLHKFYLGKPIKGVLFLVSVWAGLLGISTMLTAAAGRQSGTAANGVSIVAVVGVLALPVVMVWWFVDLLTLHRQTEKANENIERRLLHQIRQP